MERSIDSLVEEGLLIARSALRLAIKNHIIVRALRDRADFDDVELHRALRDEVQALASERAADAERLEDAGDVARTRKGRARHQTDYRQADVELLRLREQIDRVLAQRLLDLGEDEVFVREIVDEARDAAMTEILQAGLWPVDTVVDDRYRMARRARMESVKRDLLKLDASP